VARAKELLMETADDLGTTGEDNTFGWGRINLQRAYDSLVLERPKVAVSVMGTQQVVRLGQTAWSHIVLSSYSAVDEPIIASLELWFDGQPTGYFFVPPTPLTWPAGAHNRTQPLLLALPIPSGLGSEFLNRPFVVHGVVRQGANVLSQAGYTFTLAP
jgi:hypothetical protein